MTTAPTMIATDVHASHWWRIHLPEPWQPVSSDDLTLDEIERLETVTGVPWARLNPLASLGQAKGWLMVAALHAGASEAEAVALVDGPQQLNLRQIKGAFQLHSDGDSPHLELVDPAEVEQIPPSSGPTSAIG